MKAIVFLILFCFSGMLIAGDFLIYDKDGKIVRKYHSVSDHLFIEGYMGSNWIVITPEQYKTLDEFDRVNIETKKLYRLNEEEIDQIVADRQAALDALLTLEKLKQILIAKGVLREEDFS